MLTIWDRTKGKQNVKAIASLGSMPNYLLTNNPNVKSLKDFTEKDRIAVPAAGVGFQSRTLQIETAKQFGDGQFKKFDDISISLAHPDATAALIAGGSEINSHFSSPPFQYQELQNPNVHKVLSSYDVLGGQATFNVLYTTEKFHDENPKTYKAFYARWPRPRKSSRPTSRRRPRPISAWSNRNCPCPWLRKSSPTRKSTSPWCHSAPISMPRNCRRWAC